MKKPGLLGLVLVLAAFLGGAAEANQCLSSDAACIDSNDPSNPLSPVTSMLPAQGIVAVGGDPAAMSGYAFVDGDAGNADPLDGYLGVNAADAAVLSGDTDGDFNRAGGNTSPPEPPAVPAP